MRDAPFSDTLVDRLAHAQHVAVLTGAGISAESGIPTFRDAGGLWDQFEPQELANVDAFLENPTLVQGWYRHRQRVAQETQPNPGHRALAALEAFVPQFTLITQNVDNLHQRAGSEHVVELHGNILRSYCIECGRSVAEDELEALAEGEAAHCPDCGGLVRPDVVWFGEMLPADAIETAMRAARACDVFLSIGTSAVVYPAAGLPITAKEQDAYVAEVNIERSAIASVVDEVVLGKSGEVLPPLVDAVKQGKAE